HCCSEGPLTAGHSTLPEARYRQIHPGSSLGQGGCPRPPHVLRRCGESPFAVYRKPPAVPPCGGCRVSCGHIPCPVRNNPPLQQVSKYPVLSVAGRTGKKSR